jgi:hypothetical protein
MVVRIRFPRGPRFNRARRKNRHVALAAASLLNPAVLTALALGLWKLAADLRVAGQFAIGEGVFSHWQVWLGIAALVQIAVIVLNRYGHGQPLFRSPERT